MISIFEVNETNKMIEQENLDVRTITLGISLLDCIDSDLEKLTKKFITKLPHMPKIWWQLVRKYQHSTEFRL